MQSRTLVGVVAVVAVIVAGAVVPLRAEASEIAWIAQLPGVSAQVQEGGRHGVYTVRGDSAAVFEKVKTGFTRRGWTVAKSTNTGLTAMAVRTLIVNKGGAQVKVVLTDTMGMGQLVVTVQGEVGEAEAAAEPAAPAAPAPAAPAPAARPAAARLEVPDGATGTLQCNDSQVVVNGNRGDFTLEGKCRQVIVNGNKNRIQIEAAVESISTNGNDNSVLWSGAANPSAPRTSDLGNGNRIRKVE